MSSHICCVCTQGCLLRKCNWQQRHLHADMIIMWMQTIMEQVLTCGASKSLPNELQWNLRMLLPRKPDGMSDSATQRPPAPPAPYQEPIRATPLAPQHGGMPQMSQAPAAHVHEVTCPIVTAPMVQGPQYGLQYSEPQGQQGMKLSQVNLGMNVSQVRLTALLNGLCVHLASSSPIC